MDFTPQKAASRILSTVRTDEKNACLALIADTLVTHKDAILRANKQDVEQGIKLGLSQAMIDRLTLSSNGIDQIAAGIRAIMQLPDPVGECIEGSVRPNGLRVSKVRVPLGVIGFIYESRPNVTIDATVLAIKSGNSIVLRGGKEARHTNELFGKLIIDCLKKANMPEGSVCVISHDPEYEMFNAMMNSKEIDMIIPRGGKSLIKTVVEKAHMPVLKHFEGVCHLYVSRHANFEKALQIIHNAKVQRPGVCNALETLLVDEACAKDFLPKIADKLTKSNVELRGCKKTCAILSGIKLADEDDFYAEYLDLILSIKVVKDIGEAIEHIAKYSSGHSDGILSEDYGEISEFTTRVDSAAVFVNASTRFHDGFELGLGAEIGISTDRFHARGPVGLRELTTYKWVITGDGHVRS